MLYRPMTIIHSFIQSIIPSLVHYHSILAFGFRTWRADEASVAKSGSCKEPDFPCDRLGSKDETAGWQAKTRVDVIYITHVQICRLSTMI